jgi:hypothetical protein
MLITHRTSTTITRATMPRIINEIISIVLSLLIHLLKDKMIGSGEVGSVPVEEGQAYFELKKKAAGKQ